MKKVVEVENITEENFRKADESRDCKTKGALVFRDGVKNSLIKVLLQAALHTKSSLHIKSISCT